MITCAFSITETGIDQNDLITLVSAPFSGGEKLRKFKYEKVYIFTYTLSIFCGQVIGVCFALIYYTNVRGGGGHNKRFASFFLYMETLEKTQKNHK